MTGKKYALFLSLMLLFSFSAIHSNAQFWKKKSKVSAPKDSTALTNDSGAVLKDTGKVVKETKPVLVEKAVVPKDTIEPRQDTAFWPKENQLSFGYGIIAIDADMLRWVYDTKGSSVIILGPIYLKFEHAVDLHWTIGVNLAYGHYEITVPTNYRNYSPDVPTYMEYRNDNTFSILGRVNYHFEMIRHFDPYFGAGLGYRTSSSEYISSDPNGVAPVSWDSKFPVGFETTFGMRWKLGDNTCIYGEVGLAKSLFQFGLTYKLK